MVQVDGSGTVIGPSVVVSSEIVDSEVGRVASGIVMTYSSVSEYGLSALRVVVTPGPLVPLEVCLRREFRPNSIGRVVGVKVGCFRDARPDRKAVLRKVAQKRQLLRGGSEIDIRFGHPDRERTDHIDRHGPDRGAQIRAVAEIGGRPFKGLTQGAGRRSLRARSQRCDRSVGPKPISIVCAPAPATVVIPKTAEKTPERYLAPM